MPLKPITKATTKTAAILVVEDDPASWDILTQLLRFEGMTAFTARTGEDALGLLTQRTFDLAIIDLALPGMDGWQLLQAIKNNALTANLRAIALTAHYDPQVARQAVQHGFLACFPKPATRAFVAELRAQFIE